MHKYQPKDLTAARLSVAVAAEMKQWVKLTKAAAQADDTKIDLKSSGRVGDLRARLAEFFGIDLKTPILPSHLSGGAAVKKEGNIDAEIRAKQWEDWHALGDEWVAAVDQKVPFRLQESNQDIPIAQDQALVSTISRVVAEFPRLSSDPAMPSQDEMQGTSRQMISVWIEAVYKHHDRVALTRLRALRDLLYTTSEAAHLPRASFDAAMTWSTASVAAFAVPSLPLALRSSPPPAVPLPPPAPSFPTLSSSSRASSHRMSDNMSLWAPSTPLPYTAETSSATLCAVDSSIAGTSNIELITLPTASTLPEAIAQCESGLVARIRDAYGPPEGKKGTSKNPAVWAQYRGRITRRERLYSILQLDFRGDKDRFLAFFTKSADSVPHRGAKRTHATMEADDMDTRTFYAVNDVVEALPKCRTAIAQATHGLNAAERGILWGEKNDFEIWRELGTEQYGSRK